MTVLAGDIGGTNSRLACFANETGRLEHIVDAVYPSQNYSSAVKTKSCSSASPTLTE